MIVNFIVAEGGFGSEQLSSYLYSNAVIVQVADSDRGRFVALIMISDHAGWTAVALADRLMSGLYGARIFGSQEVALAEYSEACLRQAERDINRQLTLTLTVNDDTQASEITMQTLKES